MVVAISFVVLACGSYSRVSATRQLSATCHTGYRRSSSSTQTAVQTLE